MLSPVLEVHDALGDDRSEQVLELFATEWWTACRTPDDVRRMLPATDVVVGVARAISDETFLAVVLDVIVAADRRGEGVGRLLVDAILRHPKVGDVNSVELVCQPDVVAFYEQWGFTDGVGVSRLMRRTSDPALVTPSPDPVRNWPDQER